LLFGRLDGDALGSGVVMRGHVLAQLQAGILGETGAAGARLRFGVLLLRGQVFPAVITGEVEVVPGGAFAVLQQNRVAGPEAAGGNPLDGLLERGTVAGGAAVGGCDVQILAGGRGASLLLRDGADAKPPTARVPFTIASLGEGATLLITLWDDERTGLEPPNLLDVQIWHEGAIPCRFPEGV
jgi:hypothetical protein